MFYMLELNQIELQIIFFMFDLKISKNK